MEIRVKEDIAEIIGYVNFIKKTSKPSMSRIKQ